VELKSAALRLGHTDLQIELRSNRKVFKLAEDGLLPENGVLLKEQSTKSRDTFSLEFVFLPAGSFDVVKLMWAR
jgi:hypothetical protein